MHWTDVKNPTSEEKLFYLAVEVTSVKECFGKHTRDFQHPNTDIALSYQKIYGDSMVLI